LPVMRRAHRLGREPGLPPGSRSPQAIKKRTRPGPLDDQPSSYEVL
jgi:hypothetical protein